MTNFEFFDQYLKGKLSESKRSALEDQASHDPLLQSELKLQKGIYAVLAEERKAMLKHRLNQVPVGSSGWLSSMNIRWAAALGSLLLATGGTYFYMQYDQKPAAAPATQPIDITPNTEAKPAVPNQSSEFVAIPKPTVAKNSTASSDNISNTKIAQAPDRGTKAVVKKKEVGRVKVPKMKQPNLPASFAEDSKAISYDDFVAPDKLIDEHTSSEHALVDVETNNSKRYSFHYRFEDSKLYLYGDFDEALYKVIALNRRDRRSLFLEYEYHFYAIDDHATKITPLEMIGDSTLIRQLKKISEK